MKLFGKTGLMLASAMLMASANIHAQEATPMQADLFSPGKESPCHSLMTDKECLAFRSTLASLPKGKTRDRFMAEHTALMRERETLCSCNRANADTVILYPRVKQVAQRS
jgi:hypothetical protein